MSRVVLIYWSKKATSLMAVIALAVLVGALTISRHKVVDAVVGTDSDTPIVIAVDAGHGGRDPGAIGKTGLREKELTLDVSQRLKKLLEKEDYRVCMTRDEDEDFGHMTEFGNTTKKRRDLACRLKTTRDEKANLMVSLHANSFPDPVWYGAQTFYYGEREEDKRLAHAIQDRLVKDLGPNHRKAKSGDIYLLRNSDIPAVTVELGFLSNPREEELLKTDDYRQKLAESIRDGIKDYLSGVGLPSSPTDESGTSSGKNDKPAAQTSSPISNGKVQTRLVPSADEVLLYFAGPTNNEDNLVAEVRSIGKDVSSFDEESLAKIIVEELVKGPGKGSVLEPTLPISTKLNSVTVRNRVAYVDVNGASISGFSSGAGVESLAVFSIVNSLTELPGLSAVKLTVDGDDEVTLAGHVMLDEPFGRRASLVTLAP